MPPAAKVDTLQLSDPKAAIKFDMTNPKKRDSQSFKRYEGYKRAKTVGEALDTGATKTDLKYDLSKGYLKLVNVPTASRVQGPPLVFRQQAAPAEDPIGDDDAILMLGEGGSSSSSSSAPAPSTLIQRMQGRGVKVSSGCSAQPLIATSQSLEGKLEVPKAVQSAQSLNEAASTWTPTTSDYHLNMPQAEESTERSEAVTAQEGANEACAEELTPTEPDDDDYVAAVERLEEESAQKTPAATEHGLCKEPVPNPEWDLEDEDDADGPSIRIRLRLGVVVIKKEPVEELDDDPEAIKIRCRLGITNVKREADEELGDEAGSASGKLPHLFRRQLSRHPDGPEDGKDSEEQAEEAKEAQEEDPAAKAQREEQEAVAQFEAAQLASYESNVSERQSREARDLELLQQGSLEPLESLDEELVMSLLCCDWLSSDQNRLLLFRYLKLRVKATMWYDEPAKAYFEKQKEPLQAMLEQPDAIQTRSAVSSFLQEETAKVEHAIFEMPPKGRFVPELFAPRDGNKAGDSQGCVELD